MLQSSHSDGAQRWSIIPVPRSPPLPHGACTTHSPCAPYTPADHVTQLPRDFIHQSLTAKWEVKIKNHPSTLTAFHIVPQGFSWGIPGSPAGVTDLNSFPQAQPAQMLAWDRTFLPPHLIPQWAMGLPSIPGFWKDAWMPPSFWMLLIQKSSDYRRAEGTSFWGTWAKPGEGSTSGSKAHLQQDVFATQQKPVTIADIQDRSFSFCSQRPWANVDPYNRHPKNGNPMLPVGLPRQCNIGTVALRPP